MAHLAIENLLLKVVSFLSNKVFPPVFEYNYPAISPKAY